jgi:type IV secretion system protein VirD4
MSSSSTPTLVHQQPTQPDLLAPLLVPLSSPPFVGGLMLFVLLAILSAFTHRRPQLSDGRWATPAEVRRGRKHGLRQIARQIPNEIALSLDRLVLSDLQPSVAVAGKSRAGKTRSFVDPGIKSGIDQEWTLLVLDVKGNLMKKHAAYAHAKGYDVYVFAPGFSYSDGLNFLDFMKNEKDSKAAFELGTALRLNFAEPGAKKDGFFDPQGLSLLKTIFMLAKESPFPDLLSAWKILSLDNLANRLAAAKKYGLFEISQEELSSWTGEAAVGLRSVSHADETSVGIVGSAVTHFQTLIDPSILPCLLKSTIPLDLQGKQIVFFQIDEQAEAATAPLVATAIHMLVKRNLNAMVKRDRPLGLFLDEVFNSIRLPDLDPWTARMAEYGLFCMLGYQSDAQGRLRYGRDWIESILSNCGTKVMFNTGHPETAEKFSSALGKKDIWYYSSSRSHGKNSSVTRTEHVQQVPLISGMSINLMQQGECIIKGPAFKDRPLKLKVPLDRRNDQLWDRNCEIWDKEVCPILREQAERRLSGVEIEIELGDREVIAQSMLPTALELEALKNARELRARSGALN